MISILRDPQKVIAAKLASIRRRSGAPAAKRALYRLVVPKAKAPAPLTSAQKADRARAEMAALRARLGF